MVDETFFLFNPFSSTLEHKIKVLLMIEMMIVCYSRDPELPLSHTPRCSRHANGGGDGQPPPVYHSKEELVMANLNHFPSAGELR